MQIVPKPELQTSTRVCVRVCVLYVRAKFAVHMHACVRACVHAKKKKKNE